MVRGLSLRTYATAGLEQRPKLVEPIFGNQQCRKINAASPAKKAQRNSSTRNPHRTSYIDTRTTCDPSCDGRSAEPARQPERLADAPTSRVGRNRWLDQKCKLQFDVPQCVRPWRLQSYRSSPIDAGGTNAMAIRELVLNRDRACPLLFDAAYARAWNGTSQGLSIRQGL